MRQIDGCYRLYTEDSQADEKTRKQMAGLEDEEDSPVLGLLISFGGAPMVLCRQQRQQQQIHYY